MMGSVNASERRKRLFGETIELGNEEVHSDVMP
jgi:hypothetical protein